MKSSISVVVFTLFLSFMLTGCSINESVSEPAIASSPATQNDFVLRPPSLTIQIGEETIRPIVGSYSWSRKNQGGTRQSIEADSVAPPKLVEKHEPHIVYKADRVDFVFETPPTEYEIREWNPDIYMKTYNELNLSIHEGIKVFEVLARWEEGTASYSFLLDVHE